MVVGNLTTEKAELAEKAEAWLGVGTREMSLRVGLGLEWIKGVGILVG